MVDEALRIPGSPRAGSEFARTAGRNRPRPRRPHGPINRWWTRLHRWGALTLGLLLLVQTTTGAVLLYAQDITRLLHPERYVSTPSATPMSQVEALAMVHSTHPELGATSVQAFEGVYLVRGPAKSREFVDAFVDPGSGRINAIGSELPGPILLLINIHDCALTCEGLPGYQPWLTAPLPELFGQDMTVGFYLLGALGTLLVFLALSGASIWWPGIRALAGGFLVRRKRGAYVRDLDLHRVIGIVAVPFLAIWGFTGAAFYFDWPASLYSAALPGEVADDPPPLTSGTGPLLTLEQARDIALAHHPGAEVVGMAAMSPARPGGSYGFRLRQGFDPYRHWNWAGNTYVGIDSHGAGVQDYNPEGRKPLAARLWDDSVLNGVHFGSLVPSMPRLLWLALGLSPIPLAVTGLTIWLTKSRSNRNRRRARRSG